MNRASRDRASLHLLRIVLLALLMASLPVRGYAAAGMLIPQGMHGAVALAPMLEEAHAPMHDHAAMMRMQRDDASAQEAAPQPAREAGMPDPSANNCSYCGDCCSAGTLQTLPLALHSAPVVTRVEARPVTDPASFVADLLLPPPNRLLA